MINRRAVFAAAVLGLLVSACGEEAKPPPPVVRAVKTVVVKKTTPQQERRIAGTVEAVNRASLAFEVSGTISSIPVVVGARVVKGQVLARLDQRQYEINMQSAEAEVRRADADYRDKERDFKNQETLFQRGVASRTARDRAEAAFKAALGTLDQAKAKLSLAKRDLDRTVLRAPYPGVVSKREAEPAQAISAGQPVLLLQGDGPLEVQVNVPEALINFLKTGDKVGVTFPTLGERSVAGRIREMSSRGEEASTYPVTVILDQPPAIIRPGMAAEVTFTITMTSAKSVFLVPVSALSPGEEKGRGFVYVFVNGDAGQPGVMKKRAVTISGVRGNLLQVASGLSDGERVAVAGVSFLHDGMRAKLLGEK